MNQTVEPHLRPCYTCGNHDDAPRVQATDAQQNMALFHYQRECVPDSIYPLLSPVTQALVDQGLKDDALREAILAADHPDLGLDPTHANYIGDEAVAKMNEVSA